MNPLQGYLQVLPATCSIGDIVYADSANHMALTSNRTTTRKFLSQIGDGTNVLTTSFLPVVESLGGGTGPLGVTGALQVTGGNLVGPTVTGTANQVSVLTAGTTSITASLSSTCVMPGTLALTGNFVSDLLFTDATYDIGKSGATRPRDGFFSRNVVAGGTLNVSGAATFASNAFNVGSGQLQVTGGNVSASGTLTAAGLTIGSGGSGKLNVNGAGTTTGINAQFRDSGGTPLFTLYDNGAGWLGPAPISNEGTVLAIKRTTSGTGVTDILNVSNDVDANFRMGVSNTGESDKRAYFGPTLNIAFCFQTNSIERIRITGAGDVQVKTGSLALSTAGKGIEFQSGTGARAGSGTLVAGTLTVTNTTIAAGDHIQLTRKTAGGTIGDLTFTLSAGASFTINSASASDTSVVEYLIYKIN